MGFLSDLENSRIQNTNKTQSSEPTGFLASYDKKLKDGSLTTGWVNPITSTRTAIVENKDVPTFKEYNVDQRFFQGDWYDQRAANQSVGEKWLYGSLRGIGSVGTKIMADIGYLGGAIGYAATGDINNMTQNGFSAYFEGLEQDMKETLPIYKPSWVENGNFWDQVSSLSFWMDEGVDGAAFMASMMVPGLAISKGLKIGTKVARILNKGAKVAGAIDTGTIAVVNTIGEAAIEAKGTQNRINQQLQQRVTQGTMTQEEADKRAADGARDTFFANSLILLGPNLIQSRWLLGKSGFASAERSAASKVFNPLTGELVEDVNAVTKRMLAKNLAKEAGVNVISEGLWEENAQLAIENYNVSKAEGTEERGMIQGILGNMIENFTTTEGQISMFLGAVLGQPVALRGAYKSTKAEKKQIEAYHKMFGTNYQAYSDNLKKEVNDVFKKQINPKTNQEEFVLDEKGKRVVDEEKLNSLVESFGNISKFEQARTAALLGGDRTGFDYLNNLSFANWVIPMLESGESSLDMVNKQIDLMANDLFEEIKSVNEAISPQEQFDIDKHKAKQKAIAKDLYDVIQKETDYSGIWDAPKDIKSKEELNAYNDTVKSTIREKAFQQATISWLDSYRKEKEEINKDLNNELITSKISIDTLEKQLRLLKGKKEITEDGTDLSTDEETKFIKENFDTKTLERQIAAREETLKELKSKHKITKENIENNLKSIETLTESINIRKDVSKGGLATLTNRTLEKQVKSNWEKAKTEAEKIKEQVAKEEKIKSEQQDKVENKDSNTQTVTDKTVEQLEKELATLRNELAQTKTIEEFGEIEEDQSSEAIARKIRDIQSKIDSMKTGTPANQIKNQEIPPVQESEETSNTIVSEAMTSNPKLNPEKQGSFNNATIVQNLGNQVVTSQERNTENVGNRSNVVMHTQLESTVFKIKAGKITIRIFYFNSDSKGNPINSNTSGVDFDYVNNSTSLQEGTSVEYRKVTLSDEQKKSIQKSIDKSINNLKILIKRGEKIDESNNYGFGSVEDVIGIFSEDKLIGFVQLPDAYQLDQEDSLIQKATRDSIIEERKAILEKLNKGEKVTTTILIKGKGNYFSKHKDNKAVTTNEDGSQIRPEVREIDKFEGKSLFAHFNSIENKWIIPYGKSNKKVEKELEVISRDLNDLGFTGFNGQMVMLVRTANGSYSPIPVFTTKLNEADVNSVWDILVQNRNFESKDVITALNPYVFASIGLKSNLRVYPESDKVYLEIDGQKFDLKDSQSHEAKIKPLIRELRKNIVATEINNKEYQDNMLKNDLTTNVITINGQYFIQPYIQLESIISEEKKTEIKPKIKVEPKVESKTTTTTFQANIPFETKQIKVAIKGKRTNFTLTNGGKVLDSNNTEVTDNQIINSVLEQEAKDSDNFVALTYDGKKVKALAALTKSDIGLTRSFKLVYLNGQEVSVDDAIEILKNNPEVDLLKKQCK